MQLRYYYQLFSNILYSLFLKKIIFFVLSIILKLGFWKSSFNIIRLLLSMILKSGYVGCGSSLLDP